MKRADNKLRQRDGGNLNENKLPRFTTPNSANSMQTLKSNSGNLHNLISSETHLKQISENINQVLWLRDFNSGQILYVSPAFESVWGRSCDSLYVDPEILIESVHPEDRVQVLVARSQEDHKPIDQAYRILRLDGSMLRLRARYSVG